MYMQWRNDLILLKSSVEDDGENAFWNANNSTEVEIFFNKH